MASGARRSRVWIPTLSCAVLLTLAVVPRSSGQIQYQSGQNIAPAFEGWEENSDGSFNLLFGYLNRNFQEKLYIPIGPDNTVDPGGPDQGQPTYFLPRRNRHVFRVRVPKDFGNKEMVWTITAHGKTERVYGTLNPDYVLDAHVLYRNNTGIDPVGATVTTKLSSPSPPQLLLIVQPSLPATAEPLLPQAPP